MSDFAAVVDVSTLVTLSGESAADQFGRAVDGAGDFNHDGWLDIIVGANGFGSSNGAAYILYGGPGGFASPAALNGLNGVRLTGPSGSHAGAGQSVAGIGDFNGDGIDDVVIARPYGGDGGGAYVVYGAATPTAATVSLDSLTAAQGFRILGQVSSGMTVDGAGDVNGDGLSDVIVSDVASGLAYVVFGHQGGYADFEAFSGLNGANGFRLFHPDGNFGLSVASAGDVNGDGFGDLIVGAPRDSTSAGNAGRAYVLLGHGGYFGPWVTSFGGGAGFEIAGSSPGFQVGYSVHAAGDVNGDGFDDVVIGALGANGYGGVAYVVFGHGGAPPSVDLDTLDGSNGFALTGGAGFSFTGFRVSSAGDINNDGFDDVLIGAPLTDAGLGAAYVVFGKTGGFSGAIDLSQLNGQDGFKISGDLAAGYAGISVGAAGDLNQDGYDDLLVGANSSNNSPSPNPGHVYVLYGHANGATPGYAPVTWTGTGGDDAKDGGAVGDILSGGAGKDMLNGLAGDDALNGDAGNDTLSGGDGADTVHGGSENDIVNGDDGDDDLYGDDGNDKVSGGTGGDRLYGGAGADQLDGGDGTDVLDGGAGNDSLNGGGGADAMSGGAGNDVYYVDDDNDTTVELAGEGVDIVRADRDWALGANVEQLEIQGTDNWTGTGNELANRLTGNDGDNTLSGLDGADTLLGGAGEDALIGGKGNDLMTGGSGRDIFIVAPESVYSSKAPAGRVLEIDFVYDLNKVEGDYLNLSPIDADINTVGINDAFTLVGAFTKTAGQMTLVYNASANQTVLSLDVDGDAKADYQMKITGDVRLDSGGWIL